MKNLIKEAVKRFLESSKSNNVRIVSHFDTDGITSASIICRALSRANISFTLNIVKSLSDDFVRSLPTDSLIIFLDLGSGSLDLFSHLKEVFVIDHHEIKTNYLANTFLINPHLIGDKEELCSAGVSYLFAKELDINNVDLAHLAVIGTVGDLVKNKGKLNMEIESDANVSVRKGLLLYPATRPVDKVLEYSSSIFIPGVTGNPSGVIGLLNDANIPKENGKFKSIVDLSDEENSRLITSIFLKRKDYDNSEIIGNIYLINFFGKLEDAREISALINACSRAGFSHTAFSFCLNNRDSKKEADKIHARYKQEIIDALNYVNSSQKVEGSGYVIFNAKDRIRDTMIGTISSIMAFSSNYKEGTSIVGMGYFDNKIKVSMRIVRGLNSVDRKANELIGSVMNSFSGEWGGHASAAGCTINREDEEKFIDSIKKRLEIELVHI